MSAGCCDHVAYPCADTTCDLLQALGAVADGLTAAYAAVRPEVQSGALPPKVSAALACELQSGPRCLPLLNPVAYLWIIHKCCSHPGPVADWHVHPVQMTQFLSVS